MKKRAAIIFVCLLPHFLSLGDIKSTSGNIDFDTNSDGQVEFHLDASGLGVSTTTASANLHVVGNTIVENGNVGIGTTATNSTLEISGSFAISVESISTNTRLSGNTLVLADTSSDNVLINLPYAGNVSGRQYTIKKTDAANSLWVTGGGNTIDDLGSVELKTASTGFPWLSVVSNGSHWQITSVSSGGGTVASANLIYWLKLEESSGNLAKDSSSSGVSGNLINGIAFGTDSVDSPSGKGLNFNATPKHLIDSGTDSRYDLLDNFTISAWVNWRAASISRGMFGRCVVGTGGYALGTDSSGNFYFLTYNGGSVNNTIIDSSASLNIWYHLTGVLRNGTKYVYLNGVRQSDTDAHVPGTVSTNLQSGRLYISHDNFYWHGYLDDIRIYDRPLTDEEIQALYMLGEE